MRRITVDTNREIARLDGADVTERVFSVIVCTDPLDAEGHGELTVVPGLDGQGDDVELCLGVHMTEAGDVDWLDVEAPLAEAGYELVEVDFEGTVSQPAPWTPTEFGYVALALRDVTPAPKGMTLGVARAADLGQDCTAGGITSQCTGLTLMGAVVNTGVARVVPMPATAWLREPDDEHPPVVLVVRDYGNRTPTAHLVPAILDPRHGWIPSPRWCAAGGNFACWSDSRVNEFVDGLLGYRFYGALAVHDRYEG